MLVFKLTANKFSLNNSRDFFSSSVKSYLANKTSNRLVFTYFISSS